MKKLAMEDVQNKILVVSLPDNFSEYLYKAVAEISLVRSYLFGNFEKLEDCFNEYEGFLLDAEESIYEEFQIHTLTEQQQVTFTELDHLFKQINESVLEQLYTCLKKTLDNGVKPSDGLLELMGGYSAEMRQVVDLMVSKIEAGQEYSLDWFVEPELYHAVEVTFIKTDSKIKAIFVAQNKQDLASGILNFSNQQYVKFHTLKYYGVGTLEAKKLLTHTSNAMGMMVVEVNKPCGDVANRVALEEILQALESEFKMDDEISQILESEKLEVKNNTSEAILQYDILIMQSNDGMKRFGYLADKDQSAINQTERIFLEKHPELRKLQTLNIASKVLESDLMLSLYVFLDGENFVPHFDIELS